MTTKSRAVSVVRGLNLDTVEKCLSGPYVEIVADRSVVRRGRRDVSEIREQLRQRRQIRAPIDELEKDS